jgi:hypothetical protein
MPQHDPKIAASDATAFENIESILLERHGASGPKRFPFGTPAFDRGMLMAHILHRLVRRHSLNRRIGGVNS